MTHRKELKESKEKEKEVNKSSHDNLDAIPKSTTLLMHQAFVSRAIEDDQKRRQNARSDESTMDDFILKKKLRLDHLKLKLANSNQKCHLKNNPEEFKKLIQFHKELVNLTTSYEPLKLKENDPAKFFEAENVLTAADGIIISKCDELFEQLNNTLAELQKKNSITIYKTAVEQQQFMDKIMHQLANRQGKYIDTKRFKEIDAILDRYDQCFKEYDRVLKASENASNSFKKSLEKLVGASLFEYKNLEKKQQQILSTERNQLKSEFIKKVLSNDIICNLPPQEIEMLVKFINDNHDKMKAPDFEEPKNLSNEQVKAIGEIRKIYHDLIKNHPASQRESWEFQTDKFAKEVLTKLSSKFKNDAEKNEIETMLSKYKFILYELCTPENSNIPSAELAEKKISELLSCKTAEELTEKLAKLSTNKFDIYQRNPKDFAKEMFGSTYAARFSHPILVNTVYNQIPHLAVKIPDDLKDNNHAQSYFKELNDDYILQKEKIIQDFLNDKKIQSLSNEEKQELIKELSDHKDDQLLTKYNNHALQTAITKFVTDKNHLAEDFAEKIKPGIFASKAVKPLLDSYPTLILSGKLHTDLKRLESLIGPDNKLALKNDPTALIKQLKQDQACYQAYRPLLDFIKENNFYDNLKDSIKRYDMYKPFNKKFPELATREYFIKFITLAAKQIHQFIKIDQALELLEAQSKNKKIHQDSPAIADPHIQKSHRYGR